MLDKIFQIVLYKGLTVGRALKYSVVAFVLFNLAAFTWHLHKDMGGIFRGLNGYATFYSNHLSGHFLTYESTKYPIQRKFLFAEEEWNSALLGYTLGGKGRELPDLSFRAPLCDLKSMQENFHKQKKCKIVVSTGRKFCKFSPNCRGLLLHQSLWDDKKIFNEILEAAFNPCRYLPNKENLKGQTRTVLSNTEFRKKGRKLYTTAELNYAVRIVKWNGCLTPLPPITRLAVYVTDKVSPSHRKDKYILHVASLNRKTNEITIQSGDE